MKPCVVIPVHNEAREIGRLVEALRARNLDVVVIDDGSTDDSGKIAREKGAEVIRHEEKQGKGISLKEGFRYALEHGYDGVLTMDGDGQHSPGDLDRFLMLAEQHAPCIVTGSRMDDLGSMPWIRRWTNRAMSGLISSLCRQQIPDTQCGYRYVSSEILAGLELKSRDFEIETEVLVNASKKGHKIYSVPIQTIYRNEQSKINPLTDTFRFFAYLLKEMRSRDSL